MSLTMTNFLYRVLLCAIVIPAVLAQADQEDVLVTLPGVTHDLVYDAERQLIYISVPETNTIVFVSAVTFEIVDEVIVGTQPRGIDLSHDHSKLFAALHQANSVAVLDLETREVSIIFLTDLLGDPRTNDVVEARANELFVSASPGSNGFAWIVKVNLDDNGNPIAEQRVASNRIIRANPIFGVSPDEQFLYIGEGFSPNSLYKLDLNQDDAPIILEDDHGSISGSSHLELNPDGSRMYLASGQVLDTATFLQYGLVGSGTHQFGNSPDVVFIADEPNLIKVYDTGTGLQIDQIELNCDFDFIRKLLVLPGDLGKLVLGDDVLCGLAQFGPPPDCDAAACSADLDGDCTVGPIDLAFLLGAWGPCLEPPASCPADIQGSGDGIVGPGDLAVLLGEWGPCD